MSPLPESVVRWQGAEGTLGRPRAIQRTAETLGGRQGWLLRGIAALDGGRLDAITEVCTGARQAGHPDIAAVLQLLLDDPAGLAPTQVRKQAKAKDLAAHTDLAFLDLLRALAVFRTGEFKPAAKALRVAAGRRPVLQAVVAMLTSSAQQVMCFPELAEGFGRAEQVVVAARALRAWGRLDRHFIEQNFDHRWLDLDPRRWPDLDHSHAKTLRQRIDGRQGWRSGHDDVAEWLYHCSPADKQRWLGPMVHGIVRGLQQERIGEIVGMVHAASHLAADIDGLVDLSRQLQVLEAGLSWSSSGGLTEPHLILRAWEHRAGLPLADRLVLANLVLDEVDDERAELSAALVVAAHAPAIEGVQKAMGFLTHDARGWVASGLAQQGASALRQRLVLGLVDAARGRFRAALDAVPPLVEQGQAEGAARIVMQLGSGAGLPAAAIQAAAEAFANVPITAVGVRALVRLASHRTPLPPRVAATAQAGASSADPAIRGPSVVLLSLAGQGDDARRQIQLEGRALRKLSTNAADEQALVLLAHGLDVLGEQESVEIEALWAPLVRFLLRNGPDLVVGTARRLPSELHPAVISVYLRHHEALDAEDWWTLICNTLPHFVDPPPPIAWRLEQVLAQILDKAPRSWEGLVEALDEQIDLEFPADFGPMDLLELIQRMPKNLA